MKHGKLDKEAMVPGRPDLIEVGGQTFSIYELDYSNLDPDEESDAISESELPNSKHGDKQRQKLFKDRAAKNPINGNDVFPSITPDFYSAKGEDVSINPMQRKHALMQYAFFRDDTDPPGTLEERESATKVAETEMQAIFKWIIGMQPADFKHPDSGKSASKRDKNFYACPGCSQHFRTTAELVAHIAKTLEHQRVIDSKHPAFFFHLGKCTLTPDHKAFHRLEKKLKEMGRSTA